MFSRLFGRKQSKYGNYGRFGQKNSSATRKIVQKPRYLYKESFYTNKPKQIIDAPRSRVNQSYAQRSHKSRPIKNGKSRRLGIINSRSNQSPSILIHKSRKNRSRYRY